MLRVIIKYGKDPTLHDAYKCTNIINATEIENIQECNLSHSILDSYT